MSSKTISKVAMGVLALAFCLAVAPATAEAGVLGVYYRTAAGNDGVEVTGVLSGSEAERVGLEVGDRILSVDGKPIRSKADFQNAMDNAGSSVRLRIRNVRTGQVAFRTAYPR